GKKVIRLRVVSRVSSCQAPRITPRLYADGQFFAPPLHFNERSRDAGLDVLQTVAVRSRHLLADVHALGPRPGKSPDNAVANPQPGLRCGTFRIELGDAALVHANAEVREFDRDILGGETDRREALRDGRKFLAIHERLVARLQPVPLHPLADLPERR